MKKITYFFFFALLASGAHAQITLDQTNVPHTAPVADVRAFNSSGISVPAHGANLTYNYSALSKTMVDTIPYLAATRSGFSGFTRFNYGSASLSGIPLYSEYYTHKTANGIADVGSYKLPQPVPIGTITGNSSDTLNFPGNGTIFSNIPYDLKFPATMGTVWSTNYFYKTDFNLTVGAYGLNKTPGYQKQRIAKTDTVVGWGQLQLPTAGGVSQGYDVLLVKSQRVITDSIFLAGNPAPQALLSAFGLTQGQSRVENTYYFYAANFERPLLIIGMSTNWQTATYSYHTAAGLGTIGLDEARATPTLAVYPMPAQRGGVVTFRAYAAMEAELNVFDVAGKCIHSQVLTSVGQGAFEWRVPTTIPVGVNLFILTSTAGSRSGKLIVE